jgi:1,4-dihydroxy-2-naphthoate octaprenyltransferase
VVKGKRTVGVRFGKHWSRTEYLALLTFAYLAPLYFWLGLGYRAWMLLLPWLTLPIAVRLACAVLTLDRFQDLVPMTPRAPRSS